MKDAEELYKYLGSVEASFALLSALCLPRFASVASRIAAVLAEKAGIPNYVPSGAWSSPTHVVAQPSFSNLYEGVVKWGLVEGFHRRVVSRGLLAMWNCCVVDSTVGRWEFHRWVVLGAEFSASLLAGCDRSVLAARRLFGSRVSRSPHFLGLFLRVPLWIVWKSWVEKGLISRSGRRSDCSTSFSCAPFRS